MQPASPQAVACALLLLAAPAASWKQWHYQQAEGTQQWRDTWGFESGPRARRGHTLVLSGDSILMFGGRDNEITREHVPRTFNIEEEEGELLFTTYEDREVIESDCDPLVDEGCSDQIPVGLFYNDVWEYNLNCTRHADTTCVGEGETWQVLHPGAFRGGCQMVRGREICTAPSERWLHGAAMFDDGIMLMYGGFSQRCEDYCDDLWAFDTRKGTADGGAWMEIDELGKWDDAKYGSAPGKRWRFSLVSNGEGWMAMFGGFRLWHGFAKANSEANDWGDFTEVPEGGYLDDLWFYDKKVHALDEAVSVNTSAFGTWRNTTRRETCHVEVGATWGDRNDVACDVFWPDERAGHVASLDPSRNGMWLHGGYRTNFPYLRSDATGSGPGTASGTGGFTPYPSLPFYLDDLWFYNLNTGFWSEVLPLSTANPAPRVDHVMFTVGDVLLMFGGYAHNHHYNDLWYFNKTTTRWLLKDQQVHPMYQDGCVDDLAFINDDSNGCFELQYPKKLKRNEWAPEAVATPDPDAVVMNPQGILGLDPEKPYLGIFDKGGPYNLVPVKPGTPVAPFAATGPRQFVRVGNYTDPRTETHANWTAILVRCTTVASEPTRNSSLDPLRAPDGLYGRREEDLFIAQPRRQAPGWDGCRDRFDGNLLLGNTLQYTLPTQRSAMGSIYVPHLGQPGHQAGEIFLYGGVGHLEEHVPTTDDTHRTVVSDDMWRLGIHDCPKNCSFHGACSYGFCRCWPGYYGSDCSNSSCPGDYCYYDDFTNKQVCRHCCHSGYDHDDLDIYLGGNELRKLPCSEQEVGQVNGVCDGFSTCQCAPPFIGDDCSIKDCPLSCSDNGWCSTEYPVSRCVCNPGYYGDHCQFQVCLNNCSFPNGLCNITSGKCGCRMTYVPYVNTRPWYSWGGEDCSFIAAYASARRGGAAWGLVLAVALGGWALAER